MCIKIRGEPDERRKKGFVEQSTLLFTLLAVAFFIVIILWIPKLIEASESSRVASQCQSSILLNSEVRFRDGGLGLITKEGSQKERIPVNCPRLPDKTIHSSRSTPTAIKYDVMKIFAAESYSCHSRYLGNKQDIVPFATDSGVYCGVCRKLISDDHVKEALKDTEADQYLSFLMNTRNPKTKNFYSQDLYGFTREEKIEFADYVQQTVEETADQELQSIDFDAMEQYDFSLDPLQDYYIVHIIIKGEDKLSKALGEGRSKLMRNVALAGGTCGIKVVASLAGFVTAQWWLTALIGASALACLGTGTYAFATSYSTDAGEQVFIRYTLPIPVRELDSIGCDPEHIYGMEQSK